MKRVFKILLILIIILLIAGFLVWRASISNQVRLGFQTQPKEENLQPPERVEIKVLDVPEPKIEPELPEQILYSNTKQAETEAEFPPQADQPLAGIPPSPPVLLYDVPFAPQAPFGNWDMPYQEACEEAAMIMAAKYFKKEKLDKQIMDEEILKLIAWEEKNNYPIDLTADQIVEILEKYFSLSSYTETDVSVHNIKNLLNQKNLIIMPAAGRQLGNPYFRQPGPLYHNLVIIGYDEDEFITNDPGTKRGEEYRYKYFDLVNAIHDWPIDVGRKVMVVVHE